MALACGSILPLSTRRRKPYANRPGEHATTLEDGSAESSELAVGAWASATSNSFI
jgi:hypothetical protein